MCPACISFIALAVAGATSPGATKAFLARRAERIAAPGKAQLASLPEKENVRHDHQSD
jgi:hypothetical protein